MSNLGLEQQLAAEGIEFLRAKVGDRYVLALLKERGGVLGGETSGHLLCLDRTTTGDGSDQRARGARRHEAHRAGRSPNWSPACPSSRRSWSTCASRSGSTRRSTPSIQDAVRRVEDALGGSGRVVLRASGTEPVIRVMVEGREEAVAARAMPTNSRRRCARRSDRGRRELLSRATRR